MGRITSAISAGQLHGNHLKGRSRIDSALAAAERELHENFDDSPLLGSGTDVVMTIDDNPISSDLDRREAEPGWPDKFR